MMSEVKKNTKDKAALMPRLRFSEFEGVMSALPLAAVADFVNEKTNVDQITPVQYVSTENLLPDFGGMNPANKLPSVSSVTSFRLRDILVSNIRPYLRKVWQADMCGGASNDVIVIRPTERIKASYLAAILRSDCFIDYTMRGAKGVKMPRGEISMIREFPVPYPCPAEQQKIADCLSSLDELITAETQKLDALKTHKKGLMQLLFPQEGETVPRLRFPEFRGTEDWSEATLRDLIHFQDGFAFKSTDFVKAPADVTQVIRISDINNKNTNEDKVYIPTSFLEKNKLEKYRVCDGDLLLSLTGAAGFNFFLWNGEPAVINQRTAKVTSKRESGDTLLRLMEPLIHEKINERGEGQNNNLSKEFLNSIVIRIPDPEEQTRIANCLSSLDDIITAQTQKANALKAHKQGLMQQLFPVLDEVQA